MHDLTYSDVVTLTNDGTTASTSGTAKIFNLGGLYVPITGGHQPYGFDQLMALYRRYRVKSVDIQVTLATISATSLAIVGLGILAPSATFSTDSLAAYYSKVGESPFFRTLVLGFNSAGQALQQFNVSVDIAKLSGLSPQQFEGDLAEFSGTVSANPSKNATMNLNTAGTATSQSVYAYVKLTYHAEFFEKIGLAQS